MNTKKIPLHEPPDYKVARRKAFEQETWKYANKQRPQSRNSLLFDAGYLGFCLLEWSGSCGGKWRNVWFDRIHSITGSPE